MNLNTNLPTIQNNEDLIQAVEAKELYKSLGLNIAVWARWANTNIESNPFAIEGLDYQGFNTMLNGNESKNYLLSIQFAKKLAMQVRTEKGEEVRSYFIECEEVAKQQTFKVPTTLGEALQLAANQAMKIEADAKKVNHYDTIVDRTGLVIATNIGNKLGVSATKLNRLLEDLNVYNMRTKKRAFKQWFIDEGYGIAKQANMGFNQCLFTLKGEAWIVEQLTHLKAVPEANIERITVRQNHTNSVIAQVDSLLAS